MGRKKKSTRRAEEHQLRVRLQRLSLEIVDRTHCPLKVGLWKSRESNGQQQKVMVRLPGGPRRPSGPSSPGPAATIIARRMEAGLLLDEQLGDGLLVLRDPTSGPRVEQNGLPLDLLDLPGEEGEVLLELSAGDDEFVFPEGPGTAEGSINNNHVPPPTSPTRLVGASPSANPSNQS